MIQAGNETLSSILGWISIACWAVVYTPQIIENFKLKSGEGLSVLFVVIWLVGDLCNLFGAILAGLIPTIIILAAYYAACDFTLLGQIYYYRWINISSPAVPPLIPEAPPDYAAEDTPLLAGNSIVENEKCADMHMFKTVAKYAGTLLFVFTGGVLAWAIDESINRDKPRSQPDEIAEWRSQVLGWTSALMFLGARIPQILKNFKTRCEGLSPALFVYAIAGNLTYAFSILAISLEPRHLVINASWLAGSGLTVFLDVLVLFQFLIYKVGDRRALVSGEP